MDGKLSSESGESNESSETTSRETRAMAPSTTTNTTPIRKSIMIRPRSLSLTSHHHCCCSNPAATRRSKRNNKRNNTTAETNESEKMVTWNATRRKNCSGDDEYTDEETIAAATTASAASGSSTSRLAVGTTSNKSTPLRSISERGRRGQQQRRPALEHITSFSFSPPPVVSSLIARATSTTIDKPQQQQQQLTSKLTLHKTPSTPASTTKLAGTSTSHSGKVPVAISVSSPTNTNKSSRNTLLGSPGAAGGQQKKMAADDPNPFGADLVRYQNGVNLVNNPASRPPSTNGGKEQLLDSSVCNTFRSDAEDAPFLASNLKECKDTTAAYYVGGRKAENHVDNSKDKKDLEKTTGMNAWSGYATSGTGFLRNRFSTRRIRNRLMQKDGECNISLYNVPKQKSKYFADIFTTLVEVKWRWCLLIFALGFLLSWLLFATVYYLIMLSHGDFDRPRNDTEWKFCVRDVHSFVSVFMFSLESQHTIGYGSRYPTDECPAIVATVCLQSMVGVMIQTFMAGIVFAKLARAKKRAETLIFSKNSVVCMRDGKLCFLFRVGDMRRSQLAEAHVRLQMISKRITNEGELLPFHQFDMNVGYDIGLDRIFVVWPITICHVIDESSPLYEYSADDLATARFEIIAILEGVVPSTGTTTQARTSYLPQEIIWGSRFEKLVTYQRENGEYRIDFSKFHKIYPQETPNCSARELDLLREAGLNLEEVYHLVGDEEAENDEGLTPYSTVDSRLEPKRPSILPATADDQLRHDSVIEIEGDSGGHLADTVPFFADGDMVDDETGRLLPGGHHPPPSTAALITMTPAERKASIAAAAAAFRKNKSLSESTKEGSSMASNYYYRFRKPSINVMRVSPFEETALVAVNPVAAAATSASTVGDEDNHNRKKVAITGGGAAIARTPLVRILRHASSTGSVPVSPAGGGGGHGCNMKARPSSVLREHDIM